MPTNVNCNLWILCHVKTPKAGEQDGTLSYYDPKGRLETYVRNLTLQQQYREDHQWVFDQALVT